MTRCYEAWTAGRRRRVRTLGARWAVVKSRVMLRPVSEMIAIASLTLIPGISASAPAAFRQCDRRCD